jgi:hypothetical protein
MFRTNTNATGFQHFVPLDGRIGPNLVGVDLSAAHFGPKGRCPTTDVSELVAVDFPGNKSAPRASPGGNYSTRRIRPRPVPPLSVQLLPLKITVSAQMKPE